MNWTYCTHFCCLPFNKIGTDITGTCNYKLRDLSSFKNQWPTSNAVCMYGESICISSDRWPTELNLLLANVRKNHHSDCQPLWSAGCILFSSWTDTCIFKINLALELTGRCTLLWTISVFRNNNLLQMTRKPSVRMCVVTCIDFLLDVFKSCDTEGHGQLRLRYISVQDTWDSGMQQCRVQLGRLGMINPILFPLRSLTVYLIRVNIKHLRHRLFISI